MFIRSRPTGRQLGHLALASSVAALAAACSQGENAAPRAGLNRPLFTEDAYGVSTSTRVVNGGPVPKGGGVFKLGSPYKVAGRWYVPREEPYYDRTGVASWYGDDFHGRKTANGEIFDKTALSAAHPTLPLPSYAYVTNIDNGRTILVRVNDRGPYVSDRLIDLSHASARALGYENQGRARVRVRYAGRAPLNGDDRRERQFLAEQRWNSGRDGAAVAAYHPPQPPEYRQHQYQDAPAERWSATSYRAALAGKPNQEQRNALTAPPVANWPNRTSSFQQQNDLYVARPAALAGPPPVYAAPNNAPLTGRAYVQVGIFRDRANAERLRRDLGTLAPVEVAPLPGAQGAEFFRVRLGPMSAEAANSALDQVSARGVSGGAVVFE